MVKIIEQETVDVEPTRRIQISPTRWQVESLFFNTLVYSFFLFDVPIYAKRSMFSSRSSGKSKGE